MQSLVVSMFMSMLSTMLCVSLSGVDTFSYLHVHQRGNSVTTRQKRSLWSQVKTILKGTDLIVVSAEFRLYYKMGGLKQAVEDFNKLNPKDVKIDVFQERSGVVAGVRVYLKTTDGPPTLVIPGKPLINNDFRVTRTIAYYETFEDIYKPYDKWLH